MEKIFKQIETIEFLTKLSVSSSLRVFLRTLKSLREYTELQTSLQEFAVFDELKSRIWFLMVQKSKTYSSDVDIQLAVYIFAVTTYQSNKIFDLLEVIESNSLLFWSRKLASKILTENRSPNVAQAYDHISIFQNSQEQYFVGSDEIETRTLLFEPNNSRQRLNFKPEKYKEVSQERRAFA